MAPENPDYAQDTASRNEIDIEILSDKGNVVSEQLGLVFSLAEELRPIYLGAGLDIPAYNGDDTFRLPVPATYIVGTDGIIKADFVNADYTRRMEPAEIVAILQEG
jgi:peroxiredoxin